MASKITANVKNAKIRSNKKRHKTKSKRAGLKFPVNRILRILRDGDFADKIAAGSAAFLAAVMEYLTAEILVLAGDAGSNNHKRHILSRHLQWAIMHDKELKKLLAGVTFSQSHDEY